MNNNNPNTNQGGGYPGNQNLVILSTHGGHGGWTTQEASEFLDPTTVDPFGDDTVDDDFVDHTQEDLSNNWYPAKRGTYA